MGGMELLTSKLQTIVNNNSDLHKECIYFYSLHK